MAIGLKTFWDAATRHPQINSVTIRIVMANPQIGSLTPRRANPRKDVSEGLS
jgi:hypothetical protein